MAKLYLDLNKANLSSAGSTPKRRDQSVADYEESFGDDHVGAGGGDVPVLSTSPADAAGDEELEQKRKLRNKKAQERNLVPTPEEVGMKKALDGSAMDMVKSFTANLRDAMGLHKYTESEREFLQLVKGYSEEDLIKGTVILSGTERDEFSAWLCSKALRAINNMYRR